MSATTIIPDRIDKWREPQSEGTQAVARLHSVTKRYGSNTALDQFSFEIHPGEIVALLGPNGAGKTTAVRLLLGLISPDSGSARVLGRDPRESSARTRIGAMLQIARVPENLRVRDHIDLFRSYYPAPLGTKEIVQRAGLEGIEDKFFGKLSGGQKQRLLFAIALCGNPDLVFLDEPTVGMDIEARRNLWDQIRALSSRGKSILLTTHYLEEADALANRIIVLNKGTLVAHGTPAQIKSQVTGRRIRCVTELDIDFVRNLPTVSDVITDRDALVITATHPESVIRIILQRDLTLRDLEISAAALEDAFVALTKSQAS
ncbi:ABC transporter ATP-binding protein [Alloacidobacterium dinghuense]|uniref:ABC transporter ATP-binding protein n=1 Tax=Alloacidobacterium dinghuense TaxID=2763107 RepID=A0A7G8BLU5_9BACT|nr:ABC transporter ATP-binding protein [Alloacidobacterium dinghuense]QNI33515.1 ABC transporter ATP-binding protein [Alloacidobacterium dinghuense]